MMDDNPEAGVMILHSIDASGNTTAYGVTQLAGYQYLVAPIHFFADSSYVAEISSAMKTKVGLSEQDNTNYPLILIFKRDGNFQQVLALPPDIEPNSVGIFPKTGDVLVAGVKSGSKEVVIRIFRRDGDEVKSFSLLDNDPNTSPHTKTKQPIMDALNKSGALTYSEIVSSGDDLLLVPVLTSQPILELNESGVVRSVDVELPKGSILGSVLNADSVPWYIKTYDNVYNSPSGDPNQGASMSGGPLLAVNPFDGSVQRAISATPTNTRIVCEANGSFLGLTSDKNSGVLELSTGAIPP